MVRYESDAVFIDICFDGYMSYELSCDIGRNDGFRGSLAEPFDLGEIIRSKGYSEKDIKTAFQVTRSESLEKFCKLLAAHLKNYAHEFLIGSSDAFKQVADFRDKECDDYALESDLEFMRNDLGTAWQNRDYNKIIELLTPFMDYLTPSELKKLEYALNKKKHK